MSGFKSWQRSGSGNGLGVPLAIVFAAMPASFKQLVQDAAGEIALGRIAPTQGGAHPAS
jgi:hypothetical protein